MNLLSFLWPRDARRFRIVLSLLSIITSKIVHIRYSLCSTPFSIPWIIYFPSFWVYDALTLLLIGFTLYPRSVSRQLHSLVPRPICILYNTITTITQVYIDASVRYFERVLQYLGRIYVFFFGIILPFVSALAAGCEVWIYYYSDVLVIWREMPALVSDPVSYAPQIRDLRCGDVMYIMTIVLLISATLEPRLTGWVQYKLFGSKEDGAYGIIPRTEEDILMDQYSNERFLETDRDPFDEEKYASYSQGSQIKPKPLRSTLVLALIMVFAVVISFFRPSQEYDMIVNSIPWVLHEILPSCHDDVVSVYKSGYGKDFAVLGFPFPQNANFGDPTVSTSSSLLEGLPNPPPPGFWRFTKELDDAWKDWKNKSESLVSDKTATRYQKLVKALQVAPTSYHQDHDPLKISNLDSEIFPELTVANPPPNGFGESKPLKDVKIRNIIHIVLESTRADVFPLRKDNHYYNMLKADQTLSNVKYDEIEGITPFADSVCGKEEGKGGNGGIVYHGAESQSSYSLKSHLYHFCGSQALPVSSNQEVEGQIYQPCMPHILKHMSNLSDISEASNDFRGFPWMTHYMQTASVHFDHHELLLNRTGFNMSNNEILTSEILKEPTAKHYANEGFVNSEGYREAVMTPYIRDMIQQSKAENKRFYLAMWTISAHWEFTMPRAVWWKPKVMGTTVPLNNYANAISFQDMWLQSLVDVLKEEGVYDETLMVMHGDHGFAHKTDIVPSIGQEVPLGNPYHKFYQIPMVFHHPSLPAVHVHANATNLSILPTILDMLLNSNSTLPASDAEKMLKSLLPVYEGQSLIRPMKHQTPGDFGDYRFTLPNNGGFSIVVESSDPKNAIRFSVPLRPQFQYTVTNMENDPLEKDSVRAWKKDELLVLVYRKWGRDAKSWVEKGLKLTDWWLVEIPRRWQLGPFTPAV